MNTPLSTSSKLVEEEMKRSGGRFDDTQTRLTARNTAQNERLRQLDPAAFIEADIALSEAVTAQEQAEAVLEERRFTLREIELKIIRLGAHRSAIDKLRGLVLSKEHEEALAAQTLDHFVDGLRSGSVENSTGYNSGIQFLAHSKAIAPHVQKRITECEAEARRMADAIKVTAKAEGVDIGKLLEMMLDDAKPGPGDHAARNLDFIQQSGAGHFADLH